MASGNQVRASHILIKHEGSRRKASWKDPDGRIISATTKESAVQQLMALRDDILSGKAKFEDVAQRYSDCSSAKRGGDLAYCAKNRVWMVDDYSLLIWSMNIGYNKPAFELSQTIGLRDFPHLSNLYCLKGPSTEGPFGRGQMQRPFEEATFALRFGAISDIIETDSGVHIIMRTG